MVFHCPAGRLGQPQLAVFHKNAASHPEQNHRGAPRTMDEKNCLAHPERGLQVLQGST